jgi:hypothetical protein
MFGHSIFDRRHADKMMEAVKRKIQNAPKAKAKPKANHQKPEASSHEESA